MRFACRVSIGVILIFVAGRTFAQVDKSYNFLPPSPNAAELGKYGLTPINMSTGVMSTSVDLYTLKTANLTIPVTLNYSSGGVQVDQIASDVGMNWSLNAGGVITRIVRDKDDLIYNPAMPYPKNTGSINYDFLRYLDAADQENFDSERDLYAFNFLSNTGKFVFTFDNVPIITPFRKIYIERYVENGETQFSLTDENGIRYFFGAGESTRTLPDGPYCGKNYEGYQETAWYLTQIVHPEGDTVYFDYERYSFNYAASVSQTLTEKQTVAIACENNQCPTINDKLCISLVTTSTHRLKRIRTNGYGDVVFHTSATRADLIGAYKVDSIEYVLPDNEVFNKWRFNYTFSTNTGFGNNAIVTSGIDKRMFLSSISQTDNGDAVREYSFIYDDIDGLPKRLSFARDHWGFFNGRVNQYLVPEQGTVAFRDHAGRVLFENKGGDREANHAVAGKGLLKRITYPTGGYTEIDYQPNSYEGEKTIYPPKKSYPMTATSHEIGGMGATDINTVLSGISQDVTFYFSASYLPGAQEDPLHAFGRLSVKDLQTGSYVLTEVVDPGDNSSKTLYLSGGRQYEVTLKAFGDEVEAHANFSLCDEGPSVVPANIPVGGFRVARVSSFSPETGENLVTRYRYATFEEPGKSSGKTSGFAPVYHQYSTSRHNCDEGGEIQVNCDFYECEYVTLYSTSNLNLSVFSGGHITYETVIKSLGETFENGYEEHRFIVNNDIPGNNVWGEHILSAPYSNVGWDNGLEKSVRKFKKNGNDYALVFERINNYVKDPRIENVVPSMVVRKKFDEFCLREVAIVCDEESINQTTTWTVCIAVHNHRYILAAGLNICLSPGNNNVPRVLHHPCHNREVGDAILVTAAIENIDAVEYKTYAHWFYLEWMKETYVDNNGHQQTTVKQFNYGDPSHLQLTQENFVGSDGRPITTKYWYPHNYEESVSSAHELLLNHIIARPIKVESYVAEKTISGTIKVYNPDGSLAEIWKRNESVPSESMPHNSSQLISNAYEQEGRIVRDVLFKRPREIHYPDGKVATLIWGYGRRYLLAQVMNKSYTEVSALLGGDFSLLEESTNNTFINAKLDYLRDHLGDAQVISYNYQPGVGVILQTDQNGVETHYTYDGMGRLRAVLDDEGNIIKTYEYQFKGAE